MVGTITLLAVFFITLLLGMPIAFSVGLATMITMIIQGVHLTEIPHNMFVSLNSFPLLAMPLFILAGDIMLKGRITKMLIAMADVFVGRLRGGLGHVNIMTSMLFGGITGMATADTTAIGSMLIPAMVEKGYDRDYSTAITIASSVIGPIIPPSLTFVVYSLAAGRVSIGGLFLAGALPGALVGVSLMVVNHFFSKKRNYERRAYKMPFSESLRIFRNGFLALLMPIIVIGGIIGGVFTATEAAGVASLYALVICLFVFKSLKLRELPGIFFTSLKTSAIIGLILGTSKAFSWVLTTLNVPQLIGQGLTAISTSPIFFLLVVNIVLLIIGTVIDTFPAILIFAPIFHPIALSYGIEPLHFGVVLCANLLIGLNTPPVGTGLFLGCAIGKVSIEKLVRASLPFTLVELVVLLLITYIPFFTLFIPRITNFL